MGNHHYQYPKVTPIARPDAAPAAPKASATPAPTKRAA